MEPEFWHQHWEMGEIGFHQHDFNQHMQAFFGRVGISPGDRVLVPLCGKSLDMLWLAQQGYLVTGIEISELAVKDFFTENGLEYMREEKSKGAIFSAGDICIHRNDFFDTHASDLPVVDAVYDRASLVALPHGMRKDYARQMDNLVPDNVRCLLVTLEYPQQEMSGPPFSVPGSEVEQLFGSRYRIECIHFEDCLAREPRFRERGLSRLEEKVYLLQKS